MGRQVAARTNNQHQRCDGARARGLLVGLIALFLAVAPVSAGAASRTTPRASLADIEQDVMCPTCGTPLMVAQSPLADRERAMIRALIARGESKAQIERAMVRQFGPGILATPPAHGFDLAAYLVPLIAVIISVLGLSLGLLRWRRRAPPAAAADLPPLPPALSKRLDEELLRYDR